MKASAGIAATARGGAPTPATAKSAGTATEINHLAPTPVAKPPIRAKATVVASARRTASDEPADVGTGKPMAAKARIIEPPSVDPDDAPKSSGIDPKAVASDPPTLSGEAPFAIEAEQSATPLPGDAPQSEPEPVEDAPEHAPASAHRAGHGHGHSGPVQRMPRPLAAAETFVEGDHVVYPTHGVGRVERIAVEEIAGHKLELIHITFEENRMTLRVPVAKARTAGLRKLATRDLFNQALDVLRGRARIKRTMWSRRAQEYEAKINSGDPLAIAEVVRDLHRNAGQPDQSFSERQIYEAAMDRLAAELAALDETDKTTAAIKLADFLKTV